MEITGKELDLFDPHDILGKYTRIFCEEITSAFGNYHPGNGPIDPQDMLSWKVWYRVKRG